MTACESELTLVSSVDRVEFGSHQCRAAILPSCPSVVGSPMDIAQAWTTQFNSSLNSPSVKALGALFIEESYWRDQLCLSWDFRTFHGVEKISNFLKTVETELKIQSISIDLSAPHRYPAIRAVDYYGKAQCVQVWMNFETLVGRGIGITKLVQDKEDGNNWKAFTLFTTLRELKGHEESISHCRPNGANHGSLLGRSNWQDRQNALHEFSSEDPVVLVVGCGQGGLASAARLKQLGIQTLVVDRTQRIGDSWRNRYHQLVLHDPVWFDHLPYMKFPDNWPIFTPKDKLAEWFESYVKIMELSVWTSTTVDCTKWDEREQRWHVTLNRIVDGVSQIRVLQPRHIIQATGHSGEKNMPAHIEGIDQFEGGRICHSSDFSGARSDHQGKKAVVVGCCNSGHDIAQDFYEHGYDVTMVQRSSTYVMSSKNGLDVLLDGLYEEGGIPVDDADLIFMGIPSPVLKRLHVDVTEEIGQRDAELLKALAATGFALDRGPQNSGFLMKYFQRGGGYYIDVGASQLIADGKIKIVQGQEITKINKRSISFANGTEIEADEIVFATGYQNMRETSRKVFGDEIADKLNDVWGLDEEGEIRTMWRASGHRGFWFMGGNLALSRYYSRLLSLQIKAIEVGLKKYTS